jgi:hypothetical protein
MEMGGRKGYTQISPAAAASAGAGSGGGGDSARFGGFGLSKRVLVACGVVLVAFLGLLGLLSLGGVKKAAALRPPTLQGGKSENFDADGRFIIPDFDTSKSFASFLPGVGGEWGMPMWAFYVNRGQGIAAFGVENKDKPLLEFTPANKAYLTTSTFGFRTMLKVERGGVEVDAQPFFEPDLDSAERTMLIGMNELEIVEVDEATGLETRVLYYTVPGEDFPALVRRVTITNLQETEAEVQIVDGLARLEPFGVNSGMLASMGRTLEGWMRVYNCGREEDSPKTPSKKACELPYFKLSASTADSAQVAMITEGNFAFGFVEDGDTSELVPMVVDPDVVFGSDTTFRIPEGFESVEQLAGADEVKVSKTPCAFALARKTLAPGAAVTVVELYGHATTVPQLTETIAPAALKASFVSSKYAEAVALTERLTAVVRSDTANPLFDAFSRQMQLDNLLRGGYPEFLGDPEKPKVYHTFSRIHGDLERDYNNFQIDTTYYSQGSGNYRDVNQNRRVDVYLFPRLKDFNLRQFLTLKQADGYNPLTVATAFFSLGALGKRPNLVQGEAGNLRGVVRPDGVAWPQRPARPAFFGRQPGGAGGCVA